MISLRDLTPGSAWLEAERRSIPLGIVGFFFSGLLFLFGGAATLSNDIVFLSGIAGAAGVFFAALALFVAYYHRKLVQGMLVALFNLTALFVVNLFYVRTIELVARTGIVRLLLPTAFVSLILYIGLHWFHMRLACETHVQYLHQLATDEYGVPQKVWGKGIYWACAAIGGMLILALLTR